MTTKLIDTPKLSKKTQSPAKQGFDLHDLSQKLILFRNFDNFALL